MPVRILRPSLDDFRDTTVLRGVLDRSTLGELKCDFYQRETLPEAQRRDISFALTTGAPLPDVEIGMRGQTFEVMPGDKGIGEPDYILLNDPCYIIDGRQRVDTLREHLAEYPDSKASLGATVHFKTTAEWERARFHVLNTSRVKVAPSVLLRNIKDDSAGLATLYGLTRSQADFCLYRRVCWQQTASRSELLTGLSYTKVSLWLHAHLAPTRQATSGVNIAPLIDRVVQRTGLPVWRANIVTFWELIDDLWGIRNVSQRGATPHLLSTFLMVFADIVSDHVDFWRQPEELRLDIPPALRAKLKKFPTNDTEVTRLAGSGGKAREALHFILVSHINSGKRTKRLIPRNARATIPPIYDADDDPDPDEEPAAA